MTSMETMTDSSPRKRRKIIPDQIPDGFFNNKRNLMMMPGPSYWPKNNKLKPLGEDDHFIYVDSLGQQTVIGLADGVGSWAKKGIDSGNYARMLMSNAIFAIQDQPIGAVDPKQVLTQAFLNTKVEGSSTACIITHRDNDNFLHAANIGDSGFVVIREDKIVYKSPIQQSRFNCPYQLGESNGYTPQLAEEIAVEVQPGDILVAGTDGLFDNLFHEEIEEIVKKCKEEKRPPLLIARTLVKRAHQLSRCKDRVSPFTQAAVQAGLDLERYMGGKYDDVTAVVYKV